VRRCVFSRTASLEGSTNRDVPLPVSTAARMQGPIRHRRRRLTVTARGRAEAAPGTISEVPNATLQRRQQANYSRVSFRTWGPMTRYSARQVPQCIGSALQLFPFPSERRHDQKSGNESSGQVFGSTRPSLAVNYTAHVADRQRFLLQGPLFSKQALALIAKSGDLRFHSELPAGAAEGWASMLALSYSNEASYAQR
jgi:hypothetical protein